VIVIKASSLASFIAVAEITYTAYLLVGTYFQPFEILIFAGILYLILTYTTAFLMRRLEHRFRIPGYGER